MTSNSTSVNAKSLGSFLFIRFKISMQSFQCPFQTSGPERIFRKPATQALFRLSNESSRLADLVPAGQGRGHGKRLED
jgi:hypothetical protein